MKTKHKPWDQMNFDELAEATRDLDEEFAFLKTKPLDARDKAVLAKMQKRGAGRPVVGKGAERINISLERGLLSRADAAAKREKIGRSELIARALEDALKRRAS